MVYKNSFCDFGNPVQGVSWYNSFSGNTYYNAAVGLSYPSDTSSLYADHDWWGSYPPDNSLFYVSPACYAEFNNPLTSDPWAGYSLPGASQSISAAPYRISSSSSPAEDPKTIAQALTNATAMQDSVLTGIKLKEESGRDVAAKFFMSFVQTHLHDPVGYVELYGCANDSTVSGMLDFLKQF